MSDNNFGTNQEAAASSRKSKSTESFGIVTVELPNGQRLDGYTLLSAKNAEKLGISRTKLEELAKAQAKAIIGTEGGVRLHIQFGDRAPVLAAPVEMTFV
jgi:hypothetical protein